MTEKQALAYSILHWKANLRKIKETKEILERTDKGFLVLTIDGHRKEIRTTALF